MNQNTRINPSILTIDELNKKAWDSRINDSIRAQALSQEALTLAMEADYSLGMAEGMRTAGFCLIRLSQYGEAYTYLDKALILFEKLKDFRGQATVLQYFGIIQRNWGNLGTSLEYIYRALELSRQTAFTEQETTDHYQLGVTYKHLGNYEKALESLYESLSLSRATNFALMEAYAINVIGSIYFETGDYLQALKYYQQGLRQRQQSGDKWGEAGSLDNIGSTHLKMGAWDEAANFCEKSLIISRATGDKKGQSNALLHLAEISKQTNNVDQALMYCNASLIIRQDVRDKKGEAEILLFVAELQRAGYKEKDGEQLLNGIYKALSIAEEIEARDLIGKAHWSFYESYKLLGDYKKALTHLELNIVIEKEIHKDAVNQKLENLQISHKAEESKKAAEIFRLRNVELAGLYEQSEKQKEEIELSKKLVEDAFSELKSTQAQLIQSEKMASLGELTAGIAHEIQNPLNFVNNFSELNRELLEEMNEAIDKKDYCGVLAIVKEVEGNEEKISHHGKRADAIVKAMLQHSRSSSTMKEPTDINKLSDEFVRLSYHGQRLKDKTFNASIETHFDNNIGKINIVPQDIGRVLLNLFNNAFYSVAQKKKQGPEGYEPAIEITTRHVEEGILIQVRDNGMGIPQAVLEKIYQPFFTTKPSGDGAGLGLSMSYDIITKGYGGTVEARTEEGIYAEFSVLLPAIREPAKNALNSGSNSQQPMKY